jgi:ABC-type branched-subunit amino acid transport system ATPase component
MGISDIVLVMDQGRLISSGPPAVVQVDPVVLDAYLGPDVDEDGVDG